MVNLAPALDFPCECIKPDLEFSKGEMMLEEGFSN